MPAPWSTAVVTSSDLFRDIQATFLSTYKSLVGQNPKLASCMRLGVPSNKRTERYGYFESTPTIDRWDRGDALPESGFKTVAYSVENLNWAKSIGFHEDDLEDIQLGDLRDVARGLAQRAAALPEEVFFQCLTGSSSARLLKAIPTAPDGAALYATTAGGAARFGATGGNIITGTGVLAAYAVRADLWNALERFRQFQDTEGEPLLRDDILDGGVTVVYGAANEEVFREAFKQSLTMDSANNPGVSNTILESGLKLTLWSTQRITDNDFFIFVNGADAVGPRPLFEQVRQAPRTIDETRENSERARRYKILSTLVDMRSGFGVNLPYLTAKVNN